MNNPGYPGAGNQDHLSSQRRYSGGGYPQQQGYPAGAYPQQQGYPAGGYPQQQGYPAGDYPQQQGYPAGGYPQQQGYPAGKPQLNRQGTFPPRGYKTEAPPSYSSDMSSSQYEPPGDDPTAVFSFSEKSIRLNFIKKVYSILTVQLLIVVGFVSLFVFEKKVNKYFQIHYEYMLIAIVVVFVLAIMMACCSSVRRTSPMNFICLFLFTVAFSFLTGIAAAQYNAREVMLAMGLTAGITLGLTLFAFQTKYDFTSWGGALFALIIVLIIGGIFCAIFPSRIFQTIIAAFGALLMSLYIIYDTQLMLGGNHKYALSPEEYVFAALNLYLDIVNLFLYILQLLGGRD